jgi:outer membrane protein OmpA-like peptidoglycan-associated protein
MREKYSTAYYLAAILILILLIPSCITVEKIRTGIQAMDRKQYAIAQSLFIREIEAARGSEKAEKSFLLGEAYRLTNQPSQALEWYLQAEKLGWNTGELFWQAGMMFKQSGQYDKAIKYLEKIPSNTLRGMDANREKDICRQAIQWSQRPDKGRAASPLEGRFPGSVYLNGWYADDRLIVTSDHEQNNNPAYKWTGRHYADVYLIEVPFEGKMERLPGWNARDYQRGNPTFNQDHTEMIYTRCDNSLSGENYCRLYSARKINGKWLEAQPLEFIRPGINYSQPCLSRDSILFFSANPPGGPGGYDIFFSMKQDNRWTDPIALPAPINTPGNEKFPTVFRDTLYFSSDYLPGLGGLDLFKTWVRADGKWSPPQNLMPPVNSSRDDFGFLPVEERGKNILAYFSSSRNNDMGLDRIFQVRTIAQALDESPEKDSTDVIARKNYTRFLSLRVVEHVLEDPGNPNSRIIGKKPVSDARLVYEGSGKTASTRSDGRHIEKIPFDTTFVLMIGKSGYLQRSITVGPEPEPSGQGAPEVVTTSIEIVLQKPFVNQEIVLQDIYYDLDQWFIREDAKPALDQLSQDLKDNPEFRVLIASHTDCRADEVYNLDLSEKRARSVVRYLVEQGIDPQRLEYKGFGESRLIETCPCENCTEKQHQRNRRTTFMLLK